MTVRFLSVAEQEYVEAIDYYNTEKPGLGYEFAAEGVLVVAVMHLHRNPVGWQKRIEDESGDRSVQ